MYVAAKHIHLICVAISVFLLSFRFLLSFVKPALLEKKLLKVAPHVIDTVLLISAGALMALIQQYPGSSPWITEKVIAVVVYILLGAIALKKSTATPVRAGAFVLAIACIAMIGKIAVTKQGFIL